MQVLQKQIRNNIYHLTMLTYTILLRFFIRYRLIILIYRTILIQYFDIRSIYCGPKTLNFLISESVKAVHVDTIE